MDDTINKECDTFVWNVVWLRKKAGYSRRQMASLLGIGTRTLDRIEAGELPPRLKAGVVIRIADHFRCSSEDLFRKRFDQ